MSSGPVETPGRLVFKLDDTYRAVCRVTMGT